ncbi:MAG: hypothetical protein ISR51_01710 [Rhodospirillales bacterium]|nr:hypothetical protein [Alphaproteobacteria bacterium]MBL6947367.1 hypothetical protein [Rhodospirillales bacterium]
MAIIIGSLGLVVGLTAIWLASTAMKRIDAHGDILLQRIRSEQRKGFDDLKSKIEILEKKNERLSEQVSGLNGSEKDE